MSASIPSCLFYLCGMKKLGEIRCISPSNIALVKYWGKHAVQLPANPSISFSLKNCVSETVVTLTETSNSEFIKKGNVDFDFKLDGKYKPEFEEKIHSFFKRVASFIPNTSKYKITIDSKNSFPHSSGIASSASAFSALSGCLIEWERTLIDGEKNEDYYRNLSQMARLGSGSAARSINGGFSLWGSYSQVKGSSDEYAISINEINPIFQDLQDTILLVDKGVKKVSSTIGHELMNNHPYAKQRFVQANANITTLLGILKNDSFKDFTHLVEEEALSLHAMMLTSNPSYILFRPNTIAIIEKVREFRDSENIPICFTLDAGANVHLIYPKAFINKTLEFIEKELVGFCENGAYICDEVGDGQKIITEIYA